MKLRFKAKPSPEGTVRRPQLAPAHVVRGSANFANELQFEMAVRKRRDAVPARVMDLRELPDNVTVVSEPGAYLVTLELDIG